jgi:small subunit ribosomal protein S6
LRTEYEVLLMLDPDLPEERADEIIQRARDLVQRGDGTWDRHEPWGRRKLAYPINKKDDGVYHLLEFTSEPDTLDELSRVLKITDGVMRHLPVRRVQASPGRPVARPPRDGQDGREPVSASVEEDS